MFLSIHSSMDNELCINNISGGKLFHLKIGEHFIRYSTRKARDSEDSLAVVLSMEYCFSLSKIMSQHDIVNVQILQSNNVLIANINNHIKHLSSCC